MRGLAFLTTLLGLTSAAFLTPRTTTACNNSPQLCSRSYSEITHLGAHDSPFVRDATTADSTSGNQNYNSTVQLAAGVRMLTAQVHNSNGEWHLCHTSCNLLDAGLLSDWLSEIKSWMNSNPNEVVTILLVNSDGASPSDLATQFSTSGIIKYVYTPPSITSTPTTWPTLQTLISDGTRLLTFVASLDASTLDSTNSYLMNEFTFIFENPYEVLSFSDFSCTADRPSSVQGNTKTALAANMMPLMNHFLDSDIGFGIDIPDVDNITVTNAPGTSTGMLGASAQNCKAVYDKAPTFILVDFFDQGPAIATVDSLNGVTNPVGRTPVSSASSAGASTSRTAISFAGVVALVKEVKSGARPALGAWIWAAGDWSYGGVNLSGGKAIQK